MFATPVSGGCLFKLNSSRELRDNTHSITQLQNQDNLPPTHATRYMRKTAPSLAEVTIAA